MGPRTRAKQALVLQGLKEGLSVVAACKRASISTQSWYTWRKEPEFRDLAERVLADQEILDPKGPKMGLIEFRSRILGRLTYPHMQQWFEWFETDENDHVMILCPPESAKTTSVLDYLCWRIYMDTDVRIGYASRSQPHAIKQVSKLKNILEQNKLLVQLCGDFRPGPGDPHPWQNGFFTVRQRKWTPGDDESDYTVAAYGAGSQITGSRFDVLIFDDPDDVNIGQADREKVWNVILQAGETRLGTGGRMIVIGNRQDEEDVYKRVLDQWEEDPDLWAVYTQAAVMRFEEEKPAEVIWPEKFGLRKGFKGGVKPDGPWTLEDACNFFDRKRRRLGHRFFLVYQNDPVGDRQKDFSREMVESAFDNTQRVEQIPAGSKVLCSLDPAPSGGAALLVYALLPPDNKGFRRRKVVDFEWGTNWRHTGIMERIRAYGSKYHPHLWVIERSATSKLFLEDEHLQDEIKKRQKARLYEITTNRNKDAGDFAVSSLRELFLGDPTMLILPAATQADKERTRVLRDQLVAYAPGTSSPHDGPMALWFAERAVRDLHLARYGKATTTQTRGWRNPYGGSWKGGAWSMAQPGSKVIVPGSEVQSSNGAIIVPR